MVLLFYLYNMVYAPWERPDVGIGPYIFISFIL